MLESQRSLDTDGAAQRQHEQAQLTLRLHKHCRGKEHDDAANDFRKFKKAEQLRLGNRDRETAVKEINYYRAEARRPEPAAMAPPRQEQGTDQKADRQNIDQRKLEATRRGAIPVSRHKVNVQPVGDRAAEDEEEKGRVPRPLGETGRQDTAGNRDGDQKQRG